MWKVTVADLDLPFSKRSDSQIQDKTRQDNFILPG